MEGWRGGGVEREWVLVRLHGWRSPCQPSESSCHLQALALDSADPTQLGDRGREGGREGGRDGGR